MIINLAQWKVERQARQYARLTLLRHTLWPYMHGTDCGDFSTWRWL